jgi:hypothetical protein
MWNRSGPARTGVAAIAATEPRRRRPRGRLERETRVPPGILVQVARGCLWRRRCGRRVRCGRGVVVRQRDGEGRGQGAAGNDCPPGGHPHTRWRAWSRRPIRIRWLWFIDDFFAEGPGAVLNQYRREFLVKFVHAYPPHSTTLVALRRHGKLIVSTQQRHTWAMDAEVRRFPTREGKTDRAGFQVVFGTHRALIIIAGRVRTTVARTGPV